MVDKMVDKTAGKTVDKTRMWVEIDILVEDYTVVYWSKSQILSAHNTCLEALPLNIPDLSSMLESRSMCSCPF